MEIPARMLKIRKRTDIYARKDQHGQQPRMHGHDYLVTLALLIPGDNIVQTVQHPGFGLVEAAVE
jgi:hypothetical protein